jgi:hypothetical protein
VATSNSSGEDAINSFSSASNKYVPSLLLLIQYSAKGLGMVRKLTTDFTYGAIRVQLNNETKYTAQSKPPRAEWTQLIDSDYRTSWIYIRVSENT